MDETPTGPYQPSVKDVLDIKEALQKKSKLPHELIDIIVDTAECWPHTTTITPAPTSVKAGSDHKNEFILRSYPIGFVPSHEDRNERFPMLPEYRHKYQTMQPKPWPEDRDVPGAATDEILANWTLKSLPKGEHPVRKIVFTIKSHDQGWGGAVNQRGTYVGSYTWFDVGLERISAFRETKLLEAWELAPWPQFRLDADQQQNPSHGLSPPPPHPIVCSLRTLVPRTIPADHPRHPPPNYFPFPFGRDPEPSRAVENSSSQMTTDSPPNSTGAESETPSTDDSEPSSPAPNPEVNPHPQYQFEHAFLPSAMGLQKNVTAIRDTKEHIITWSCDDHVIPDSIDGNELELIGRGRASADGDFVRRLKVGDVVTVWAKARFPGWINVIDEVKMDVYWAV